MWRKTLVVGALLWSGFPAAAADRAGAQAAMPPGVAIRMTLVGPVFTDSRGMTLYRIKAGDALDLGTTECSDRPITRLELASLGYNQVTEVPMNVFDPQLRRACIDKYPPFVAAAEAKSIGDWTIQTRKTGVRQWVYRGAPLHTAIKDALPGQINGINGATDFNGGGLFSVASAPFDAPPGIQMHLVSAGLALISHEGKTLYHADAKARVDSGNWRPLVAPVAATSARFSAGWSIVKHASGLRQWAWKGKPLYTYERDQGYAVPEDALPSPFVDSFGAIYGRGIPGWHIALLKAAPRHPAQVRVVEHPENPLVGTRGYADSRGAPLYTMGCTESTADSLECNDIGDSPRYWLSFCGGEERCSKTWRLLVAPAHAKSIDDVWSVVILNPRHPFKPLPAGVEGVRAWAYLGRPVFTSVRHTEPGDYSGFMGRAGSMMGAEPIVAFAGQ